MSGSKGSKQPPKTKRTSAPKAQPVKAIEQPVLTPARRLSIAHWYAVVAAAVLGVTTAFWALLGAKIQQGNADQLVNTYLFEQWNTFHNAVFPGAHTFLLKWPLFWLMQLFGPTDAAFEVWTVLLALVTVGFLAYVLYRIDRRPIVFGSLALALASVLLLVPPEPYAAGILPVNMAMVTTRNLEYVLYMVSLILFVRSPKLKSWGFWAAVASLSVLIASDKLFLTLSVGGGVLALVAYVIARRWALARLCALWVAAAMLAFGVADVLLWLINTSGLTTISTLGSSPYAYVSAKKELALGVVFGAMGVFTNFGANPAFDAAVLRNIPGLVHARMLGAAGLAYLVNAAVFIAGMYMSLRLLVSSFFRKTESELTIDRPVLLSLLLIWSSIAAAGAFVATNHYYFVDSRYMGILLFALFVSMATYMRSKAVSINKTTIALCIVLICSVGVGVIAAQRIYEDDQTALSDVARRNALVVQSLANHPTYTLMGDYWRVLPIKQMSGGKVKVTPLDACGAMRGILSSREWQPDLTQHSFAYLLSFDKSLTNYPNCTLDQVIATYGRPNASAIIAGSIEHPKEALLFYDHGVQKLAPAPAKAQNTVLPITPDQLPAPTCPGTTTVMNVVAHQDDDLLFINPDLQRSLAAGYCVRTVYITAGDGGFDKLYWQSRERGSEAAYSSLGMNDIWIQRTVKLNSDQFVTVANPRANPRVSMIFLRLPDGNLRGEGFRATQFESLQHLEDGKMAAIHSVDGQSAYTSSELTAALLQLMRIYRPTELRTQATYSPGAMYLDHSDHMAVGRYATRAYQTYTEENNASLAYYYGYPVHGMAQNVADGDLDQKAKAFFAYAKYDGGACTEQRQCDHTNYGPYLKRQYSYPYAP